MDRSIEWLVGVCLLAMLAAGVVLVVSLTYLFRTSDAAKAAEVRRLVAKAEVAEAEAERARLNVEIEQKAAGAMVVAKRLTTIGFSIALLIVTIGTALAGVTWLNKRASVIYPNRSGQWPLIFKSGYKWFVIHDPNRALGPVTAYALKAPSPVSVDFAQPANTDTMAQVTSQAQAVSLVAAAAQANKGSGRQTAEFLVNAIAGKRLSHPLPAIRPSSLNVSHVERLLAEVEEG